MSLSCLWLPGAKQGAFPSVQLRDLRPSLHLCSVHGLTTQVFLPLFLSQGRPGQTVAPLGLWPQGPYLPLQIQAEWSQHPPGLCPGLRPGGSHVFKWIQTECSPAAASKASSVQWCVLPGLPCAPGLDLLASLSLWEWPSQGEGTLCRAGPVPYSSGPHTPGTWSGPGTVLRKFSVNE